MKKLIYAAMLLLGLGMIVSCGNGQSKTENKETTNTETQVQQTTPTVEEEAEPVDTRPHVYANAFDGFVNIRETAQAKAPILGVLRNGPEGAVLLGTEGEWTQVDCNGIVGYVLSKYVQDTPTEPVDEGIDLRWLEGWWGSDEEDGCGCILIFDNGGYMDYSCMFCEGNFTDKGSYKLEKTSIVLTPFACLDDIFDESKTLSIDPINKKIVGYHKQHFLDGTESDDDKYYNGWLYLTKEMFYDLKKHVFEKTQGF